MTRIPEIIRRKLRPALIAAILPGMGLIAVGKAVLAGNGCEDSVPSPCVFNRTRVRLCTVNVGFVYPFTLWHDKSCTTDEYYRPSPYKLYWTERRNCSGGTAVPDAYDQNCSQS